MKKLMIFIIKEAYIAIKLCRKLLYSIRQSPLFPNIIVPKLKNQRQNVFMIENGIPTNTDS